VAALEGEEETKWLDTLFFGTLTPFPQTTNVNACFELTRVLPLATNVSAAPTTSQAIVTYDKRVGRKIHVSGLYINLQVYWPSMRGANYKYPPFATYHWLVVKQKVNSAAVDGGAGGFPGIEPGPGDVMQNDLTIATTQTAPASGLLFKNMKNAHNYVILARGSGVLPAPIINFGYPYEASVPPATPSSNSVWQNNTTVLPATGVAADYGSAHQYSGNTVRNHRIRLNPNTNVLYKPNQDLADLPASDDLTIPLQNGMYLMFWSDQGTTTQTSRFQPPGTAAGYTWIAPLIIANCRLRFKDA